MKKRLIIAIGIGMCAAALRLIFDNIGAPNDIRLPLCSARLVTQGVDPYQCRMLKADGSLWPHNPLTTILFLIPFSLLSESAATVLFIGISSAVLAWSLTYDSQYWRLLVFSSAFYYWAVWTAQWSIVLLAAACMPLLYPLIVLKPHIGLPIGLMHFTPRRGIIVACIGLLTLLVSPQWIQRWLAQTGTYDGIIPALVFPPILLAALRWRDQSARWLVLYALVPQRPVYDQLMLFIVPRNHRELLILTILSWVVFLLGFVSNALTTFSIVLAYSALTVVLLASRERSAPHQGVSAKP